MKVTTLDLIKNENFYKLYLDKISELEKNMTNRTPSKIGLICRWISVSGKKGDTFINCQCGQEPDLQECIECSGLLYDNVELSKKEITLIDFIKKYKNKDITNYKSLYDTTLERLQKEIFDYMKESITEFLEGCD